MQDTDDTPKSCDTNLALEKLKISPLSLEWGLLKSSISLHISSDEKKTLGPVYFLEAVTTLAFIKMHMKVNLLCIKKLLPNSLTGLVDYRIGVEEMDLFTLSQW